MKYSIYATRKESGDPESEITHYQYVTNVSNSPILQTKEGLWNQVKGTFQTDQFFSCNTQRGTTVVCEWRQIGNGQPFLKSDPNGTKKDNLLELPNC